MAHPENEALFAWLREVLRHQAYDGNVVLSDGKSEAAVCVRGDSLVLVSFDDESTVLAKVELVPR